MENQSLVRLIFLERGGTSEYGTRFETSGSCFPWWQRGLARIGILTAHPHWPFAAYGPADPIRDDSGRWILSHLQFLFLPAGTLRRTLNNMAEILPAPNDSLTGCAFRQP